MVAPRRGFWLLLAVLACCCCGGVVSSLAAIPTPAAPTSSSAYGDGAILCELYDQLISGTQSVLHNWCEKFPNNGSFVHSPCSSWTGIGCADFGGVSRVVSLNIDNLRVVGGTLPASISGLGALTLLDVGVNSLKGEIPSTLGLLTRLVSIP